jgi:integrase
MPWGQRSHTTFRRWLRLLKRDSAALWHQDVMRHTCASYLLASEQDAGNVALWLGNSPKILVAHYWGLAKEEDATAFWSIFPSESKQTSTERVKQ